jgi:hypothetical protein
MLLVKQKIPNEVGGYGTSQSIFIFAAAVIFNTMLMQYTIELAVSLKFNEF